jgi:hypothetical protein
MPFDLLIDYAHSVREQLRSGPTNVEQALAPKFQWLIESLLPTISSHALVVVAEFAQSEIGRPDIALKRAGQPPRAFIELKAPQKPDDPNKFKDPHDKRQFERFKSLPLWALSNFSRMRVYRRDDPVTSVEIVPEKAIDPKTPDAKADKLIRASDPTAFIRALTPLAFADPPAARDARELAANLAHAARLVRAIVEDLLTEFIEAGKTDHPLQEVRDTFRDVLYAHPEAGGFSAASFEPPFSAAFAQTLAFGLLLAREATGKTVDSEAWKSMPPEHPLMRTALRVLSQEEVAGLIGVGFDVMLDTVNSLDPKLLVRKDDGYDPILYFYEDFLEVFDPEGRKKFGVYYTPIEVVRYMVGALDRVLKEKLGTEGLIDQQVTLLDPATGTGTFLVGIAQRVRRDVEATSSKAMAAMELRALAERMFAFELLVGPYAVAHYRLHHTLAEKKQDGKPAPATFPRVGIFLTDTLSEPGADAPAGKLGFVAEGIRMERKEADRIKQKQPVLVILGNPPYRRLETGETATLVGDWMAELWDDFKSPVRDAGWGNQLNTFPELSVAFWRWAIWKLFECDGATRRGVVAFISNRTFIAGKPYAGLRKMLREKFDRIEIIDLRGDVRRGERAGVAGDQGVFNIQVGTAITLAIAGGNKVNDKLAEVTYIDSWSEGLFGRKAKLSWLAEGADSGTRPGAISVDREDLDDMKPKPFQNGLWASLQRCFEFHRSGIQTKRDDFVYSIGMSELAHRISAFVALKSDEDARAVFHDSRDRKWTGARSIPYDSANIRRIAYRPLDNRFLYNHRAYGDFLRPELQSVFGEKNFCLYAMPFATAAGPAVWCHGILPDYHAFRGSYGGYAFPLYDRRPGHGPLNVSPALLAGLAASYGVAVTAQECFDVILALLSAKSYTLRFAEDLEDVFPHIPFPGDNGVFAEAAKLGAEIRVVETFARPPSNAFLTSTLARVDTPPNGGLTAVDLSDGELVLCGDGSGRITGIRQEIWEFSVSGYRVLPRWLAAREGQQVNLAFVKELRDIVGRIAELIDLFERADSVLTHALSESLTRDELGLGEASVTEPDDDDAA